MPPPLPAATYPPPLPAAAPIDHRSTPRRVAAAPVTIFFVVGASNARPIKWMITTLTLTRGTRGGMRGGTRGRTIQRTNLGMRWRMSPRMPFTMSYMISSKDLICYNIIEAMGDEDRSRENSTLPTATKAQ